MFTSYKKKRIPVQFKFSLIIFSSETTNLPGILQYLGIESLIRGTRSFRAAFDDTLPAPAPPQNQVTNSPY